MDNQKKQTQDKKSEKKDELEKLKNEVEDNKNKYLRALADYHNLERRFSTERQEITRQTQIRVATKLFPIIDNLEKAEVFIQDPGLKLVKDSFTQFLTELGIKELEVLNKPYDPHTAEAIDIVSGEKNDEVVEVVQKGYEMDGKIIRIAQVKVSKNSGS